MLGFDPHIPHHSVLCIVLMPNKSFRVRFLSSSPRCCKVAVDRNGYIKHGILATGYVQKVTTVFESQLVSFFGHAF